MKNQNTVGVSVTTSGATTTFNLPNGVTHRSRNIKNGIVMMGILNDATKLSQYEIHYLADMLESLRQ